ncbi:hypothetical protein PHABIO_106 [Pseudomonas phage Phabio]|uniref:Uncharacterized protein n=1 Tax=Pseudomonas phage Phabio TaxID=2006668 RepID=A0A1Y0T1N6_9CAUD|nr:hypothetical protein MZD05_gp106 [Pseudomonas phage Phabio]ARV76737.1 hypothetical protein PHABIO_106 [Pseudomonas phage Phabio]
MSLTLACYNEILPAFSCSVDEEDMLDVVAPTGAKKPATIGGATLVLPTQARLRKGFPEELFPFHPLCESMSRQGTSPVIQFLQRAAKANISYSVVALTGHLLEIACDVSMHKDLPPECLDFLVKLSDCDKEKNIKQVYEKVVAAASKKNRMTTVYLKNGGTFDGQKVNRSCIIRIPLLEDLQQDGKDVLGVTVTKKQRKILTALFKLVVPFGDNPEEYSFGTTSRQAPYFQCLLTAYAKIVKVLNQCINNYAVPLQLPIKPIPTYDIKVIETFEKARAEVDIPPLRGNEGGVKENDQEASETKQPEAQAQQPRATVQQNTRESTPPVAVSTSAPGTVSMEDFMKANNPNPGMVNVNFNGNQQPNVNGTFGQQGLFGAQPTAQPTLFGNTNTSFSTSQPTGLPWNQPQQTPVSNSLFGGPSPTPAFQTGFTNNGFGNTGGGLGLI